VSQSASVMEFSANFILSPHNTHHTGMQSNLDPGRTDVCTQINNYNTDTYNF